MAYNGWTNYETWCVHLWLSNDEATYNHCQRLAAQCRADAPSCRQVLENIWPEDQAAKFLLADLLKEQVEDGSPLAEQAMLYSDLLQSALSEVDWHSVAEAFLEE